MILTNGKYLLSSLKDGVSSIFPVESTVTDDGNEIKYIAVVHGGKELADKLLAKDISAITTVEFSEIAQELKLDKGIVVIVTANGSIIVLEAGINKDTSEYEYSHEVFNHEDLQKEPKLIIGFDDGSWAAMLDFTTYPLSEYGVILHYATYATHNDALSNNFDIYDVTTGVLTANDSIENHV